MKRKSILLSAVGLSLLILCSARQASATLTRFIQIVKNDDADTRFHLAEVEAFEDGVTPNEDGAEFDGKATSTNDIGDGELTTYGDGELFPDIGTTASLEHGGANKDPNNALETGGGVWSTANGLAESAQYTLDLGAEYDITTLRLWPRADTCCSNRWMNLEINLYGDDGGKPGKLNATATHTEDQGNVSLEFTLPVAVNSLTQGLIGYWSFNDLKAGSTEALDASANGNVGTVNGDPEIVAGASGLDGDVAINFDGSDDSVTTKGNIMNDIGDYTMSGWVKFDEQGGNRVGLFGQNDAVEFGMINPNTMQHWTAAGGSFDVPFGPVIAEWTNIIVVATPEQRILYVDGEEAAVGGGVQQTNSAFNFNIGGDGVYDASGNFFTGQMDDVAVWDRPLTADEAKKVFETRAIISPDFIDTDGDGMPDGYEGDNGLDPFSAADKDADKDGDGLSNFAEFTNRTNPNDKDTDKDGLNDNVETNTGTWVSASNTGTNPTKADSDKDGLPDGVETNTKVFVSATDRGTDPHKPDTDGDLLEDGREVSLGTDPLDANSKPAIPPLGPDLIGMDLTDPEDDGDPEDDIGYNAVFASSEEEGFGGGEFAFNVFDNVVGGGNDKWCCGSDGNFPDEPIWIQATFEDPIVLSMFSIASANDTVGRDPLIWEIQGSNDGENFETIFRREDEIPVWEERNQVAVFTAGTNYSLPGAYTTIRFTCFATGLTGGARFQISELEFFGSVGSVGPFQITGVNRVSRDGSEFLQITWPSTANGTYAIETGLNLDDDWTEVEDGFESEGESTMYELKLADPVPAELYIRVRAEN